MKKVLIAGPLLSISGYGYHSRQIFDYFFNNLNFEVSCIILPWGNTAWFLEKAHENFLIGKIIDCAIDDKTITQNEFDVGVHIQLPSEWNNFYAKTNIGVSAYVETDICSKSWIENTKKMSKVIVPSNFTKNTVLSSENNEEQKQLLDKKVFVVPEYYHVDFDIYENKNIASKSINNLLQEINTQYNYLSIGHLTSQQEDCDRKSLVETIKYFCEFYKDNSDVGLILKTSFGRSSKLDKKKTNSIFENIIASCKGNSIYPKVYLLHGEMSIEEIYSLYAHDKVKCYLSLTKGEGYGLPLLEAARCGLPIIATNWSGHLDFLGKDFLPIECNLKEIPDEKVDNNIFVKYSKWAKVKKNSVFKQLKFSFEDYNHTIKTTKKLKLKIINNFNKQEISKKYDEVFKEYE